MSNLTRIRTASHDELSSKVEAPREARSELGPSVVAIVASVVIMAGLMTFRLWWLMPALFLFQN